MPPFSPDPSAANSPPPRRPISRVNSLKRDWTDSSSGAGIGEVKKLGRVEQGTMYASKEETDGSQEMEWLPSPPERSLEAPPPAAPQTLDAAARRRAAVLSALASDNLLPAGGGPGPSSLAAAGVDMNGNGKRMASGQAPWAAGSLKSAKRIPALASYIQSTNTSKPPNVLSSLNIKQKILLSSEQRRVLEMVVAEGKSLFFTGSAGTGKSVLLREIISSLKKKYARFDDAIQVTASTGIAACNIGGVTLHSFGGIGLGMQETPVLCSIIRKNKKALGRWLRTKVLVIDEISMVDGDLFDKLAKIGSILRKNSQPFGGIQIVVTGDFFQLPPVHKGGSPTFAFEAQTWSETVSASVNLTQVFRQKDQTFVDMLNEMRFGRMSQQSSNKFASLSRPIPYNDGIEPTELFPRREDVDRANSARLNALRTESWTYQASDGPGPPSDQRDKVLSNMMAPQTIILKKDAQVMLIKNVDETLVNGSMGKVIGFVKKDAYREDKAGNWIGKEPDEETEEEDLSKPADSKKKQRPEVSSKPLPVVSFRVPGGGRRDVVVDMDTFKVELPNGEVQAQRLQLPLILAWAMSIHKSQGQTLDRVKVDLGRVFEKGQAYVALSRATSLEGLQVLGFNQQKVQAHPKVTQWSERLVTFD